MSKVIEFRIFRIINLKEFFTGLFVVILFLAAYLLISQLTKGHGSTPFHQHLAHTKNSVLILHLALICGVLYLGIHYINPLLYLTLSISMAVLGWYFFRNFSKTIRSILTR